MLSDSETFSKNTSAAHCQKTWAKPKSLLHLQKLSTYLFLLPYSPHENFLISFLGIGTVETFTWIRENEELQDKDVIAWVHSHVQGKFILILRDLCL